MNATILHAYRDELRGIQKEANRARMIQEAVARKGGKAGKWLKEKLRHAGHGVVGGKSLKPGEVSAAHEAKKFAKNPIKRSKESFQNMGMVERSLLGGLTGMEAVDAAKAPKGEKGKRVGSMVGGTAGWLAFRKAPLVGSLVGMMASAKAGEKVVEKAGELKRRAKIMAVHGR